MASGAEEEGRARREAGEEETDEDDERPQLSASAAGALREFLEEQGREGTKGSCKLGLSVQINNAGISRVDRDPVLVAKVKEQGKFKRTARWSS
ncbi:hypothetical protein ZWY2020_014934 [Hordeum vulgare]|nr:hypothetical protein ZWY2020_014934 [Hordeum vulgare]